MAETIKQTEATPETRPTLSVTLTDGAAALSAEVVWQRLETWTAYRWGARDVVWIMKGCGESAPPVTPATVATVEVWDGTAWAETVPLPSPLGYELPGDELPGDGPYRINATVGDDDLPEVVQEAWRRLAEYLAASASAIGVGQHGFGFHGVGSIEATVGDANINLDRQAAWQARAIQNSGAAELLRPLRRA